MILDVGCGDYCRGDVCLDVAHTKACQIIADAHYLPFHDSCFDSLVAQALLEHLENPTKALKEFMRVLKPNGSATLTVPKPWLTNNFRFFLARLMLNLPITLFPQLLKIQFTTLRRLKTEPRIRHKSVITRRYMMRQAEKIGFKILEFTEMEDLLFYYFPRRIIRKHGWLQKIFRFKPKLHHGQKIICQKHNK